MTAFDPTAGAPFDDSLLSAWLDDECTPAEAAAVEAALASPDVAARLAEVASARTAVRSAPWPEPPAGFWDRVHAAVDAADGVTDSVAAPAPVVALPVRRRPTRWVAALGAAAAAVVAAVVLVPGPATVRPAVGTLVDAHALRSSIQGDAASTLAPIAVSAGFRP